MQQENNQRKEFGLEGYRDLELSTQVLLQAALRRGLQIEVLERSSHAVRLREPVSGRSQIVIQASKTSKDSYLSAEIMALKTLSKRLLAETGLAVPQGRDYQNLASALADWPVWQKKTQDLPNRGLIVKPNSTNYGIGITKLEAASIEDYRCALELALVHDSSVLVEEYVPGKEYRFLVIDGMLQAVMHRIPANVCGDGVHTVAQLVATKNRDPYRQPFGCQSQGGQGGQHTSPLEQLQLTEIELAVLQQQGFGPASIPRTAERVWLRHNSNISTGGDSQDVTEHIHPGYRPLAEAGARAMGANICGLDLISADIAADPTRVEWAIIEANFNPVLYCHEYPAQGRGRSVAAAVVELLFPQT